jgi:alpha-glucosidase
VLFMGNHNMVEEDPWSLEREERLPGNSLLASRRYPFRWTGDAHTTWSELQWHINAITNTFGAMAGIDYITADAYAANWKQQARWNQFLAFSPVARSHTMKPWDLSLVVDSLAPIMAFGDKRATAENAPVAQPGQATNASTAVSNLQSAPSAENSIRNVLRLRYRLLPYLYSTAHQHYRTGFPITRPMVLAFPNELHGKFNRLPYQYMFGDAFLVAPVWADLNAMDIFLPEGSDWIDYWSKQLYKGGQSISYDTSNVEKLPLFVKAGSIIPMGRDAEWIDANKPDDFLTLDIYPSAASAAFTLYEDDGVSTLYQSGQFATTTFECRAEGNGTTTITLGATKGTYQGKPAKRTVMVDLNSVAAAPAKVLRNGAELPRISGASRFDGVSEGWAYEADRHVIAVKILTKTSEQTLITVAKTLN